MADAENATAALKAVAESADRLLHTVTELDTESLGEPSALPGWSRGHVLTHLARNADSLVNLLDGARTGRHIPQYASETARDDDIRSGAGRPLTEQLADLRASDARFTAAAAKLSDDAWSASVRHRSGAVFPAWQLPVKRRQELEYHHVDLGAGYTPAHWPEDFAVAELVRLARQFAVDGLPAVLLTARDTGTLARLGPVGAEPELTVEGPVRVLTAWISGRADGDGLQVHRGGELLTGSRNTLPELPPLG
ncbi:maleylpyruvate isomerase family mycothiol-dependent enzyme [Kitasatospora sp. GP82]|uniref:maleylpyruvate isomerase family mycothiol-dependent enzyme n=1 Tax=Kitasatospora sp. GP82 TaxID=3035089 RepID=UPI00247502D8|nr:maleylpyruvate isomerase family mycothiol-dependent enzyme [Kitasatospora sp. GP82]MDH6125961.1 maleylpyruvate isomerase [Kitasatospora sp. GP82]